MINNFYYRPYVALLALLMLLTAPSQAGVVLLSTRVIYPSDEPSKTLQLNNKDNIPYVMQIWTDINNPSSTPETADGPFVVLPALFRIEPQTGQSVRLTFTGNNLPQDRESVFYLNSAQIPPKNINGKGNNQMMLVLRNRLKIFYRPAKIVGEPGDATKQVRFSLNQQGGKWLLTAHNDSNYFISFVTANAVVGGQTVSFSADMVAPKSQVSWEQEKGSRSPAGAQKVTFSFINDYGGQQQSETALN
ncbi:molecular chaperone [Serratia sp. UGAL515B_01]|uniref:fimbrial biogenesis chaperone n=1 Tax=Serratia sp. UGAL515B_01 TaxID=2986763 RepID=UPI002954DC32|nr:molecular chaperone [Serratia sp. UGAL515B_01]WON76639.1 molecular chaperone [Serratia sp. UGAL515B_01]